MRKQSIHGAAPSSNPIPEHIRVLEDHGKFLLLLSKRYEELTSLGVAQVKATSRVSREAKDTQAMLETFAGRQGVRMDRMEKNLRFMRLTQMIGALILIVILMS